MIDVLVGHHGHGHRSDGPGWSRHPGTGWPPEPKRWGKLNQRPAEIWGEPSRQSANLARTCGVQMRAQLVTQPRHGGQRQERGNVAAEHQVLDKQPQVRVGFVLRMDLTPQYTNRTVLVEGPEIRIRPVGARRVVAGSVR